MQTDTAPFRDPMRRPAIACGSLVAVALLLVVLGRGEPGKSIPEAGAVVESVALRFSDGADGSVIASDATTGAQLARIEPGEGGFIRVTLRSLAAERKRHGYGAEVPFMLARTTKGDLVLSDELTGRVMVLDAFGPSNAGAFSPLLDRGATQR